MATHSATNAVLSAPQRSTRNRPQRRATYSSNDVKTEDLQTACRTKTDVKCTFGDQDEVCPTNLLDVMQARCFSPTTGPVGTKLDTNGEDESEITNSANGIAKLVKALNLDEKAPEVTTATVRKKRSLEISQDEGELNAEYATSRIPINRPKRSSETLHMSVTEMIPDLPAPILVAPKPSAEFRSTLVSPISMSIL